MRWLFITNTCLWKLHFFKWEIAVYEEQIRKMMLPPHNGICLRLQKSQGKSLFTLYSKENRTAKTPSQEERQIQCAPENKIQAKTFTQILSLVGSGECNKDTFHFKVVFFWLLELFTTAIHCVSRQGIALKHQRGMMDMVHNKKGLEVPGCQKQSLCFIRFKAATCSLKACDGLSSRV